MRENTEKYIAFTIPIEKEATRINRKWKRNDNITFVLLLQKGVYPYQLWMVGKNSMKHHYLKKIIFYSHLYMEDITDRNYTHPKRVCKDFERKI